MSTLGRNDPCPCGSGKKYKYCHLRYPNGEVKSGARTLNEEVVAELARHEFASVEEAQGFLDTYTHKRNTAPLAEFHGLSPAAMFKLIYYPFASPDVVTFPAVLDSDPTAPILNLFMMLAAELRGGDMKLTEKGNLPRAFCRSAAEPYLGDAEIVGPFLFGPFPVNKEDDFPDLQVTHTVAGIAGLVRKYRGKLTLTHKAKRLLDDHGARGIYPVLFRAYVQDYNWGYADRYPDLVIVQQSWAFTAYLLTQYGSETRLGNFYAEQFIRAYPHSIAEAEEHQFGEPEDVVARCFDVRAIQRFAEFLGLVRIESDDAIRLRKHVRVTSLPLLADAVRFTS